MPAVRRLTVLIGAFVAFGTFAVSVVQAQWPITCVELNDQSEAAAGRQEYVGIYQRFYGAGAEAACQRDHIGDVQRTFEWALPAASGLGIYSHPDFGRVVDTAVARGADRGVAAATAAYVIVQDTVSIFLAGLHPSDYGVWDCRQRSAACPLAREAPPQPAGPQVDPQLHHAWHLLTSSGIGTFMMDLNPASLNNLRIIVRSDLPAQTAAVHRDSTNTITVNAALLNERPEVAVASIAHELWHVVSNLPNRQSYDACIAEEVWGFILQGYMWYVLVGLDDPPYQTRWEVHHTNMMDRVVDDNGLLDYDLDVSDWPVTRDYVQGAYENQCGRYR